MNVITLIYLIPLVFVVGLCLLIVGLFSNNLKIKEKGRIFRSSITLVGAILIIIVLFFVLWIVWAMSHGY